MNKSHYCLDCDIAWPFTGNWIRCVVCDETTTPSPREPIEVSRARALEYEARNDREVVKERRRKHEEFEEWYAARETAALRVELDEWMAAITPS